MSTERAASSDTVAARIQQIIEVSGWRFEHSSIGKARRIYDEIIAPLERERDKALRAKLRGPSSALDKIAALERENVELREQVRALRGVLDLARLAARQHSNKGCDTKEVRGDRAQAGSV